MSFQVTQRYFFSYIVILFFFIIGSSSSIQAQTNPEGTFYDAFFNEANPTDTIPANASEPPTNIGISETYTTDPLTGEKAIQPQAAPQTPKTNVPSYGVDINKNPSNGIISSSPTLTPSESVPQYGVEGVDYNRPNTQTSSPSTNVGISDTYTIGNNNQPQYVNRQVISGDANALVSGTSTPAYEKYDPTPGVFDVVVMLPFNLQANDLSRNKVDSQSKTALELYEGIITGLQELERQGIQMNIRVFDTQKNPMIVEQILAHEDLSYSDLIIGPVYNKPMKVITDYARSYGIYHISPLSPSNKVAVNNPYYLKLNPSIETHCEAIYQHVASSMPNSRLVTISSSNPREMEIARNFDYFTPSNLETSFGLPQVGHLVHTPQLSRSDIESYLSADQENIIVVTSYDPLTINMVLGKLQGLKHRYKISVFGMPNWRELDKLELDYLTNMNFYITDPFWANEEAPKAQLFNRMYKDSYGMKPGEYAGVGYDIIQYFGNLMLTHGNNFGSYLDRGSAFNGIYNQMSFQLKYSGDYLENKYVNILKCQPDFSFRKVN